MAWSELQPMNARASYSTRRGVSREPALRPSENHTSSVLENVKAARSGSLIYVKPYAGRALQQYFF
jgi:hypothetical protein